MTGAIGLAVGLGSYDVAEVLAVLTIVTLWMMAPLKRPLVKGVLLTYLVRVGQHKIAECQGGRRAAPPDLHERRFVPAGGSSRT